MTYPRRAHDHGGSSRGGKGETASFYVLPGRSEEARELKVFNHFTGERHYPSTIGCQLSLWGRSACCMAYRLLCAAAATIVRRS